MLADGGAPGVVPSTVAAIPLQVVWLGADAPSGEALPVAADSWRGPRQRNGKWQRRTVPANVRQRYRESGHLPPSRSKASAVRDKVSGLFACHLRNLNLPSVFSAQIIRCIWTTRNKPGLPRRSNSRSALVTDWSPSKWQTATHCLLRHCSIVKNPCAIKLSVFLLPNAQSAESSRTCGSRQPASSR